MAKKTTRRRYKAHKQAAVRRAEQDLTTLMQMPGMNLPLLYRAIVMESRAVGDNPHSPVYPDSVKLLDKCTARILQKELDSGSPDPKIVIRLQRGIHGAERERVARYVAESALGAAALQVDGVNRLLRLRAELKAENQQGRTIDNMSEYDPREDQQGSPQPPRLLPRDACSD